MGNMRFKVGDRVRIKSIDWYNKHKDKDGNININELYTFNDVNKHLCGTIITIKGNNGRAYEVEENDAYWTDEMIEGLVDEEVGLVDGFSSRWVNEFNLPYGYIFKDENGNVINATKIVLKKKKEYPKTYEECAKVLLDRASVRNDLGYKGDLLVALQKLLVCRDAYWKIAGEEMGLGKPWKPDYDSLKTKYTIVVVENKVVKLHTLSQNHILTFPTEEMQDAFKENFDPDIEFCKEFL